MFYSMKAHIGEDAALGLLRMVRCTSGNVNDVTRGGSLLHGQAVVVFGDGGIS
jgi:IS5 family transposase